MNYNIYDVYAKIYYDLVKNKDLQVYLKELKELQKVFSVEPICQFFQDPVVSKEVKAEILRESLEKKLSPESFNFINAIVQAQRAASASKIIGRVFEIEGQSQGTVQGVVKAPQNPGQEFMEKASQKMSATLNKKVSLKYEESPELLSGMKIDLDGISFDDTALYHLSQIKEQVLKK